MRARAKPSKGQRTRPFLFLNLAMTADGKIATANRTISSFGSKRDREHLYELRAAADAVMAGARTVDGHAVSLDPGGIRYRRLRLRNGRGERLLRVIVSGSGTINRRAHLFLGRRSPIIVLTTEQMSGRARQELQAMGVHVKICGKRELNFPFALRWLRAEWDVKRLLCEGGGELNTALFQAGLVDEINLTICPLLFGGRAAPTLADGTGASRLADASQFEFKSIKQVGSELFVVLRRSESGPP